MINIKNKKLKLKKLIDSLEESDMELAESYLTFLTYRRKLLKDDLVKSFDEASYTKEDDIIDDVLGNE
ncbi:hypothetical protein TDSAC_0151 [Thermodesulfobium acidiphilum]|uniref:Uncharacterized protein n=1 Tax=Thermodesulfobium acidiphilum TaxID=1794699 RepID=A0A2R4VYI5_THEAF|nr:hypothetical protein [Thermodesulfobium acidiphilum]AWB09538.1 hypothetical protein TDSAC_0151 [Thermodesulfobium acidiphilum]